MAGLWSFAGCRVHARASSGLLRAAVRTDLDQRHRYRRNHLSSAADNIRNLADRGRRPHRVRCRFRLITRPSLAGVAVSCRGAPGRRMIWAKLAFGGFGRRGLEAVVALAVLAVAAAIVAGALMVIEGARAAMARTEREDRPDIIQVKSRFNRAVFETPRSGNLPPLTLPVYEPLIDADKLSAGAGTVLRRQSLLRNVVAGETFLNVYIFGIEPEKESRASVFAIGRGRFLRSDDGAAAVLDRASAEALGIGLGGTFPVRKADGHDLGLTVVGILDRMELRYPPPRTVEAPSLTPDSVYVSSGVFVTWQTSEEIFGRSALTDALVIAPRAQDVPS